MAFFAFFLKGFSASAEEMSASTKEVTSLAISIGEMTNEMRNKINFFQIKK